MKKKLGKKWRAVSDRLSFSLVSKGAHPQLYKSPQRTSQSKFLSIHAPSCLQAATESGLEINASVNGFSATFALPHSRSNSAGAPLLSCRARMLTGCGIIQPPLFMRLSSTFSYRCHLPRDHGAFFLSAASK